MLQVFDDVSSLMMSTGVLETSNMASEQPLVDSNTRMDFYVFGETEYRAFVKKVERGIKTGTVSDYVEVDLRDVPDDELVEPMPSVVHRALIVHDCGGEGQEPRHRVIPTGPKEIYMSCEVRGCYCCDDPLTLPQGLESFSLHTGLGSHRCEIKNIPPSLEWLNAPEECVLPPEIHDEAIWELGRYGDYTKKKNTKRARLSQ